jgi:non-lysosomal glucosylceramidase
MSNTHQVYSKDKLYSFGAQRTFKNDASELAFLIGGIGTGSYSMGPRGEMKDWEIFNKPAKGNRMPYTFFAINARNNQFNTTKVLESRLTPPFSSSTGYESNLLASLPRFESSKVKCEFPFYNLELYDSQLPLNVSLEAFNPFIPLNSEDSGIPAGIMRYKIVNTTEQSVNVTITGSIFNAVGFKGYDEWNNMLTKTDNKNIFYNKGSVKGIFLCSELLPKDDLMYGNLSIMTLASDITVKPEWLQGQWFDCAEDFWNDFKSDGMLEFGSVNTATLSELQKIYNYRIGSIGIHFLLQPDEEKIFEFVLSWYFPNRRGVWEENKCCSDECGSSRIIKNYYSTLFEDSWKAGEYVLKNMERLRNDSLKFANSVFSSTLPDYVLDAVTCNLTVLKSATCFRIEDGTMLAYEGCHDHTGCCPGNSTHVFNYAQAMAYLFPELERTMRRVEFLRETDDDGLMQFRSFQALENKSWRFLPAADGQLGTIIRLYREWILSGDDDFLKELWPKAKQALDFAHNYWDEDKDFVLDGRQHVTYDIELYGPNPLSSTCYYGALKAAIIMAKYLGDQEAGEKYTEIFEKGNILADKIMWNGEYYIQMLKDVNDHKYQFGIGCLSDQVFGQFLATVCDLGYVMPEEHIRSAVYSIFKYNFKDNFFNHNSVQRTYVINDEKGLLLASWPKGGRPMIPFVYSDEVWSRIEYYVAVSLIYEGFIDEGLTIVKAIRDRYDGYKRNPWDEFECGHHYFGTMSSWSLLTSLSGFKSNLVRKTMNFDPKIKKECFNCFWCNGKAWGIYSQKVDPQTNQKDWSIKVLYGNIDGLKINK